MSANRNEQTARACNQNKILHEKKGRKAKSKLHVKLVKRKGEQEDPQNSKEPRTQGSKNPSVIAAIADR